MILPVLVCGGRLETILGILTFGLTMIMTCVMTLMQSGLLVFVVLLAALIGKLPLMIFLLIMVLSLVVLIWPRVTVMSWLNLMGKRFDMWCFIVTSSKFEVFEGVFDDVE
nr:MAG TPA: hypothetical protein [Caudoviricetes sp.]